MSRGDDTTIDERLATVAATLTKELEGIFSSLEVVGNAFLSSWRDVAEGRGEFGPDELSTLRPLILEQLRQRPFVDGIGVLVAENLLADLPRHIEWWRQDRDNVVPLWLDLDPTSADVYDYLTMEWFVRAQRDRVRTVYGPRVDVGGAEHYVVTLASPVVADVFLGVVGADVNMALFEDAFVHLLYDLDDDVVVANAERRVVMSNSSRATVGDRLVTVPAAGDGTFAKVLTIGADSGWLLAQLS